jgi:hypothetical protein
MPADADIAIGDPWLDLLGEVLALAARGCSEIAASLGLLQLAVEIDFRLRLFSEPQALCFYARADLYVGVLDAVGIALSRHRLNSPAPA